MPPLVLRDFTAPRVEIKQFWIDDWEEVDYLQVLKVGRYMASTGLDYASFRSRYGRVKLPGGQSIEIVEPLRLKGYWVRVSIASEFSEEGEPLTYETLFQGRFDSQVRSPAGKPFDQPATGVQEWTAYGGYQILQKAGVNSHWCDVQGEAVEVKWVAGINTWRGKSYDLLGNRTRQRFTTPSDHYLFFGKSDERTKWSAREFIDYLIARHLPDPGVGQNPTWTIGGQSESLANIFEPIEFEQSTDVAEMLHAVISRAMGLDFAVIPTEEGFEIRIFSLTPEDAEWESDVAPASQYTVELDASQLTDARLTIEETTAHRYQQIIVQGERMVTCASFEHGDFTAGWTETGSGGETAYLNALGDTPSDAEINDQIRSGDQFRNVYQRFVVYEHFDVDTSTFPDGIFPAVRDDGSIDVGGGNVKFSTMLRRTLDWTPLVAGVDYASLTDFDEALVDETVQPGDDSLLPPTAYLDTTYGEAGDPAFVSADQLGIEIASLLDTWGLQVTARPPHLIAGDKFTTVTANPSVFAPKYNYEDMVVTIAFESDYRLQLIKPTNDGGAIDSDGTHVITVPGAQLWYIAPGTVYGTSLDPTSGTPEGQLLKTDRGIVVRSDIDRLKRIMAGAIARYHASRQRATIAVYGLSDWFKYLGYMISVVNDGTDDTADLKCPVTSIDYEFESGFQTQIRAGYA